MSFEEWKTLMLAQGCLAWCKRPCKCHPYASTIGFGLKYRFFVKDAKSKGVKCLLTFDEYLRKAFEANLTSHEQIGRHNEQYNMGRYTDSGDYAVDTCRFITKLENLKERKVNGGAAEAAKKHSGMNNNKFKGWFCTPKGRFVTADEGAKANGVSAAVVRRRCYDTDKVISSQAKWTIREYGMSCIGKTYGDLGWYFEEV